MFIILLKKHKKNSNMIGNDKEYIKKIGFYNIWTSYKTTSLGINLYY